MTDRCSAEVSFPPDYNGSPFEKGAVILRRIDTGYSYKSRPFTVRTLGDDGHVRWWCHSTTGDWADPGTWRVKVKPGGLVACISSVAGTIVSDGVVTASLATCEKALVLGSSEVDGWTPERSRCDSHAATFQAQLGPDRLLQTWCLPN